MSKCEIQNTKTGGLRKQGIIIINLQLYCRKTYVQYIEEWLAGYNLCPLVLTLQVCTFNHLKMFAYILFNLTFDLCDVLYCMIFQGCDFVYAS